MRGNALNRHDVCLAERQQPHVRSRRSSRRNSFGQNPVVVPLVASRPNVVYEMEEEEEGEEEEEPIATSSRTTSSSPADLGSRVEFNLGSLGGSFLNRFWSCGGNVPNCGVMNDVLVFKHYVCPRRTPQGVSEDRLASRVGLELTVCLCLCSCVCLVFKPSLPGCVLLLLLFLSPVSLQCLMVRPPLPVIIVQIAWPQQKVATSTEGHHLWPPLRVTPGRMVCEHHG